MGIWPGADMVNLMICSIGTFMETDEKMDAFLGQGPRIPVYKRIGLILVNRDRGDHYTDCGNERFKLVCLRSVAEKDDLAEYDHTI